MLRVCRCVYGISPAVTFHGHPHMQLMITEHLHGAGYKTIRKRIVISMDNPLRKS